MLLPFFKLEAFLERLQDFSALKLFVCVLNVTVSGSKLKLTKVFWYIFAFIVILH